MTEKLKEIIKTAPRAKEGSSYTSFLLIPTSNAYDGFWGKNGFNNIIVLGQKTAEEDHRWLIDEYERLTPKQCDTFYTNHIGDAHFDVPGDLGCIRLFVDKPVTFNDLITSTIAGYTDI